ncbi:NAD(P)-binding domain-containing protein [Pleionea sp. CnH1-48]|uniref:NAD(P)-binding domain-containing protein n=1 Tax=Pleionea sp. CnH1-48 TaxID=2954494 RepID=UPI00209693E8|nr:NAD(P)-binding domain-containing protein [Pleionea sp. CnH1-48]MCO7225125.1 NAD(P)-binding domain-containing protein [Pleionea sp. CnH1-48]
MTAVKDVIVIGAGPVGIAAAAHLIQRGLTPLILEKGNSVGSSILDWGHVSVFTPWKYVYDSVVKTMLEKQGWVTANNDELPTGKDIVEKYLQPAANLPELKQSIWLNSEVLAVTKENLSKMGSQQRDNALFEVQVKTPSGIQQLKASAVIDASGSWSSPNPMGLNGLPVFGEVENQQSISYGIPDLLGKDKATYANKRILVVGGGHSAINVVIDLMKLQQQHSKTTINWGLRRNNIDKLLGGGINDELPARGELGTAAIKAIQSGHLDVLAPMKVEAIEKTSTSLKVFLSVDGVAQEIEVDRIIVAAGFRPELNMLRELRLDLDNIVEAPSALAPLIDPNLHSCGSVKPHGVDVLSHPDKGFYIVGMKSYGRAPTFLMLTGYEQVRSIAAELAGDHKGARELQLSLPQTGVCNTGNRVGKSLDKSSVEQRTTRTSCCGTSKTSQAQSCCG